MKPPIKPVVLSEVEASLVLSNWWQLSGCYTNGLASLYELVDDNAKERLLDRCDEHETGRWPTPDGVAACIAVKAPSVRSGAGSRGRKR
jgi:hypothetical protein